MIKPQEPILVRVITRDDALVGRLWKLVTSTEREGGIRCRIERSERVDAQETAHIVVWRNVVADPKPNVGSLKRNTRDSEDEQRVRVCLGPEKSGTRQVAEGILEAHGISLDDITPSYMAVTQMVKQLLS